MFLAHCTYSHPEELVETRGLPRKTELGLFVKENGFIIQNLNLSLNDSNES